MAIMTIGSGSLLFVTLGYGGFKPAVKVVPRRRYVLVVKIR